MVEGGGEGGIDGEAAGVEEEQAGGVALGDVGRVVDKDDGAARVDVVEQPLEQPRGIVRILADEDFVQQEQARRVREHRHEVEPPFFAVTQPVGMIVVAVCEADVGQQCRG